MKVIGVVLLLFVSVIVLASRDALRWVSLGDSITHQDGKKYFQGERKGKIAIGYQTLISNAVDMDIILDNRGLSGFPLTGNKASVLEDALKYNFSNTNLVTIAAGTNDFKLNKPIGNFEKLDTTFSGSYQLLIEHIKKQSKNIKIILFTPLHRDNDNYTSTSVNNVGHRLIDYVLAIKKIACYYDLQVVDMFNKSGIDNQNLELYTMDGLHPNDDGYQKMAELFLREVNLGEKLK